MKNRTSSTLPFLALVAGLALAPSANAFFKCMPFYGNWCGPGHPAAGFPPPVDGFDAACMRHDLCTSGPVPGRACDYAFVGEVRSLAAQLGYVPRSIQWAEYAIRVKSGGPWGDMPMPTPWDAMGILSSLATPCW
jgi:hypothetical protein